jgi:hypothetical protein
LLLRLESLLLLRLERVGFCFGWLIEREPTKVRKWVVLCRCSWLNWLREIAEVWEGLLRWWLGSWRLLECLSWFTDLLLLLRFRELVLKVRKPIIRGRYSSLSHKWSFLTLWRWWILYWNYQYDEPFTLGANLSNPWSKPPS